MAACSKSEPAYKASPKPAAGGSAAPGCALAVVVDASGLSIGTPAGACHAARIDGKLDVVWLEAELRGLRAALSSCSEAEVVAETGPYHEVITTMDIAIKTGFVDVGVGDRSDLHFKVAGASDPHCKLPSLPPERPAAKTAAPPHEAPLWPPLSPEEVRKLEEPLPLPAPTTKETLQQAPVIIVTRTEITYQGQFVASVDAVAKDPKALKPLADILHTASERIKHDLATGGFPPELVRACDDAEHGIRPMPGQICPLGLAILQADESTDMRVINALLHTAKDTGFDNVLFAVKNI